MKKFVIAMVAAAMLCAACGDDSSSSAGPNDEPVSVESSSSSKKLSSSSVIASETKQSSSCSAKVSSSSIQKNSSSSSKKEDSGISAGMTSSSVKASSSSSVKSSSSSSVVSPKSSSSEVKSSSSLHGFDWSLPKEVYLNPNIDYGTVTDDRDGKTYKTVKIGEQTWMAENLNYYDSTNLSVKYKSWCHGKGKSDNTDSTTCDVAGRFYTWAAAIDSVKLANDADNPQDCGYGKECGVASTRSATLVQGVCPTGWHLPSGAEIEILLTAVGVQDKEKYWQWQGAGIKLKSISGWKDDDSESGNGTDSFGFSALPTGDGHNDGSYHDDGEKANFWSSTETTSGSAYGMYMNNNYDVAKLDYGDKRYGFSVRCVKDKTPEPSAKSTSK